MAVAADRRRYGSSDVCRDAFAQVLCPKFWLGSGTKEPSLRPIRFINLFHIPQTVGFDMPRRWRHAPRRLPCPGKRALT